jgi:hypothetical protein
VRRVTFDLTLEPSSYANQLCVAGGWNNAISLSRSQPKPGRLEAFLATPPSATHAGLPYPAGLRERQCG